jgi:hypothetical protein
VSENIDNVVKLPTAEPGDQFTSKAGLELEARRKALFRAFELTGKQLDVDALAMEKAAIIGEHPIQRRHEIMDTARCLRITQSWLAGLIKNAA